MHFRVRKNVIQLVRSTYDASLKRGVATVVGTVGLHRPALSDELRAALTAEEAAEFELWLQTQRRADALREELAALSLSQSMLQASKWFAQAGGTPTARTMAAEIVFQWQSLRRELVAQGLLD